LIIAQAVIAYKLQGDIFENTKQIQNVEAPLALLVQQGISYGSIATEQVHISVLHAQKGEYEDIGEHKATYNAVEMKLDNIFNRDSKILISQSTRSQEAKDSIATKLKEINRLNILMVDLGTKAFAAIDKKDGDLAYSLVVGGDYEKYQKELQLTVKDLLDIVGRGASDIENNILKESQQISYLNLGISIGIMIMIILTMLIIRSFVASRETAIVRKEKKLDIREKMEQRYRTLFENATDAIFIADSDTRQLIDCNESAEKLMGYSRAKILSMKADELHPKDKLKETMEGFKKQAEGKIKSILTEVLTKDKKRIPVKINASAIKIGKKTYSQGMFRELK